MTYDIVVLTPSTPDLPALLRTLATTHPDLRVQPAAGNLGLQLCDDAGEPLVHIETPILIHVPGEAERLLGPLTTPLPVPVWWIDLRAVERQDAVPLAHTIATLVTQHLGGLISPPEPT